MTQGTEWDGFSIAARELMKRHRGRAARTYRLRDNDMDQTDRDQLCAFFQRSRYDIIQARLGDEWGPLFSFTPCDVRSAQKAGQMLLRMHRETEIRVRHARRARLQDRRQQLATDIVVVTEFPGRGQKVLKIEDGIVLRVDAYLEDEALAALEAALAPTPRP